MKNSFKIAALALVLSISVSACGGKKTDSASDTTKTDSLVKTDTVKKDTSITADSAKKDTSVKTVTKTTEVKK